MRSSSHRNDSFLLRYDPRSILVLLVHQHLWKGRVHVPFWNARVPLGWPPILHLDTNVPCNDALLWKRNNETISRDPRILSSILSRSSYPWPLVDGSSSRFLSDVQVVHYLDNRSKARVGKDLLLPSCNNNEPRTREGTCSRNFHPFLYHACCFHPKDRHIPTHLPRVAYLSDPKRTRKCVSKAWIESS